MSITAALRVGSVTIENFGNVTEATGGKELIHAAELCFGGIAGKRREIPDAGDRFTQARERPGPGGAIMIRGFALGVFVAFVTAPIRFVWVV